jgi:hypothetical protein
VADRADALKAPGARPGFAVGLIVLAVAELAYLTWYWTVPLPNAEAAKTTLPDGSESSEPLRRWYLLAQAVPHFVQDIGWRESLLGRALESLGHVEYLPQRLPLAAAGLFIAAAGLGLGLLALRALGMSRTLGPAGRIGLAFGLGMTGLGVLALIAGRLGVLAPWPVRIALGVLALGGIGTEGAARRDSRAASPITHHPSPIGLLSFALLSFPFLILMLLGSLQPSLDFDSLEYHLQGPKEWFLAGRIAFLPHNVYTSMPFNVEMLHLLGMEVLGDWWHGALVGQFLVMLHGLFAALLIALAAWRFGSGHAAWVAALVYLGTPWVYRLSVFAYVEGPLGYYHAALIYAAALAWSRRSGHPTHFSPPAIGASGSLPPGGGGFGRGGRAADHLPTHRSRLGFFRWWKIERSLDRSEMRETSSPSPYPPPPGGRARQRGQDAPAAAGGALSSGRPVARQDGSPASLWGVVGALAGGAMACKYPALISAVIPFGLLMLADAIRKRSWTTPLAFAAGLSLTIGPWLAKNVIDHGNPVYPLANGVFHGRPWSTEREAKWRHAHGPRPINAPELVAGVLDVAGRNDWQSPFFTALAPLAFLRRGSRRVSFALWLYALYLFATWWLLTHRLDRFWLPMLPPLAILAGLGADWSRRLGWSVLLSALLTFGLVSTWIYDTTALAALNRWTDDLAVLRRDVPRLSSPTLAWLDENLPPDAKVLLVGQAAVFPLRHEHVYNTVFDDEIFETIARGRAPEQVRRALRDRGITHILVDWSEIARHRKPGGYGFTDFVRPEVFADLVRAGVIEPLNSPLAEKNLCRVR